MRAGSSRRDHPCRGRHVANRFGGWRDSCDRRYTTTRELLLAVAERHDRTQATEAGGHSVGEQAGADRLETDG